MILPPPPPKKIIIFKIDSMEEIIPDGALKKDIAWTRRAVMIDFRRVMTKQYYIYYICILCCLFKVITFIPFKKIYTYNINQN